MRDPQTRAGQRQHRGAVGGPQSLALPVQRGTGPGHPPATPGHAAFVSKNIQRQKYHKYRPQDASSYSLTHLSRPRTGQYQRLTMPIQTYSVPIVMMFVSWIIKNLRQHTKISFMGNVLQTNIDTSRLLIEISYLLVRSEPGLSPPTDG